MKKFVIVFALFLGACNPSPQLLISKKPLVVAVPTNLYNCPDVAAIRKKKLTEADIAHLLIQYKSARDECKASLDAIRSYLEQAKRKLETK